MKGESADSVPHSPLAGLRLPRSRGGKPLGPVPSIEFEAVARAMIQPVACANGTRVTAQSPCHQAARRVFDPLIEPATVYSQAGAPMEQVGGLSVAVA